MEICLCAPACASARTRWGAKLTRCQCRERTPGRGQERSPRGFALLPLGRAAVVRAHAAPGAVHFPCLGW